MDIFEAIEQNNIEYIKKYIDEKHKLNIRNIIDSGATPLITALKNKRLNIVKLLIDSGADINLQDYGEYYCLDDSPLHVAVFYASYENAKLLVDAGCALNLYEQNHFTPLIASVHRSWNAISTNKEKFSIAKLLIESGCKLNTKAYNFKQCLYKCEYYENNKDKIDRELIESFRVRHSLIQQCVWFIKTNIKLFNRESLNSLCKDIKLLFPSNIINKI